MPDMAIEVHTLTAAQRDESEPLKLVLNSWIKNARGINGGAYVYRGVDKSVYFRCQHDLIKRLTRDGFVHMACVPGFPDQYLGWIAGRGNAVHFAYVKAAYRNDRVFARLVDSLAASKQTLVYTHKPVKTWLVEKLRDDWGWEYDPYRLFKGV